MEIFNLNNTHRIFDKHILYNWFSNDYEQVSNQTNVRQMLSKGSLLQVQYKCL